MEEATVNTSTEKVIELSPKNIGIVVLLIFVIATAGYFLLKNSRSGNTSILTNTSENKPPVARFTVIEPCYAYSICQLDASESYDPDGVIEDYKWYRNETFVGGGKLKILQDKPNRNYNVTLKVTDKMGSTSSTSRIIEFKSPYRVDIPSSKNRDEQISVIKSLCKAPIKLPNYPNYYNGYINDFHTHIFPGNEPYNYTIALLTVMNEFGVKRATLRQYGAGVEGDHNYEREKDKTVAEIAKLCPERFDPFLAAVYPDDSSSVDYVRKSLDEYPWKGIGEIYIKNKIHGGAYTHEISNLANTSTMMQIYKIAAEKKIPFHFHLDSNTTEDIEAIRQAIRENPQTIFVWAHGCNGNTGFTAEFSNLYCEFEFVYTERPYKIDLRSDRLIIGTDASVFFNEDSPLVQIYHFVISSSRFILGTSLQEIATPVASGNYERVVGG